MRLEVVFLRAYALPPAISADEYGAYSEELFNQLEAKDYRTEKIKRVEQDGLKNVTSVVGRRRRNHHSRTKKCLRIS
jgi:hypothetical protein